MRTRLSVRLLDTDRDRAIAAWLDSIKKDKGINVSEIIKNHLYHVATGRADDPTAQAVIDALRPNLTELRDMLSRGIVVSTGPDTAITNDETDAEEVARRLGSMLD